ncbi:hypothetical protein IPJ72_04975 [Candidatus Peregrinibacteria bacterium]|nr:MAG: hypothetical protein IPJ72_04975 [Candidatus Peregrinibacteria bacterium]
MRSPKKQPPFSLIGTRPLSLTVGGPFTQPKIGMPQSLGIFDPLSVDGDPRAVSLSKIRPDRVALGVTIHRMNVARALKLAPDGTQQILWQNRQVGPPIGEEGIECVNGVWVLELFCYPELIRQIRERIAGFQSLGF